jgi:catechol 2,3-dioxygenase
VTEPIHPRADVGHVHLKVADLDRALAFWHETLGFELQGRIADKAAFVAAGGYHHHIGLNTFESEGGSPPAPGTTGLYHVAVRYPDHPSLVHAARRVLDAGVELDHASDHGATVSVYLADPDGNGVELYYDRPADEWPRSPDGSFLLIVEPVDLDELLADR